MNERRCHRCDTDLHIEAEGALVYCFHCGAPRIYLSEELQEQAAERLRLELQNANESHVARTAHSANGIDWNLALKLAMAVSGTLAVLSVVLPPLFLLIFAWAPVAPAVVLSLYAARGRNARFTAAIGARIGIVCGAFIVLSLSVLNAVLLDVLRYGLHRADVDKNVNTIVAQVRAQTIAQSGQGAVDFLNMLNVPEFRTGFFLASFAGLSLFVILLSTGGGALAGTFHRRRRVS